MKMRKSKASRFHDGQAGAAITVSVTQNASRNEIHAVQENGLIEVRLTEKNAGRVNEALLAFLEGILGGAAHPLEIVAGIQSSEKLVTILGLSAEQVQEKILAQLPHQ